jgi:glucose-1-phosphate adenylyltransferase
MVNSSVAEVGVITKSNYGPLLDHLGSGRDWDLARKKGGLHLLPPYSQTGGIYKGRLDALNNVWSFVEHSCAKYVIMSNCDVITTIDFNPVLRQHKETEADITLVYSKGAYDCEKNSCATILEFDEDNRLKDVLVDPQISGECNMWLEMCIISRDFLKKIVSEAASRNQSSFTREILQGRKDDYKIMGFEHKSFFTKIDSVQSYYKANMLLLDQNKKNALFKPNLPVLTKIGDNGPVKYGLEANVKNSLIADGCIIEGTVENSILFRGVKVGKGTVVKNCVLLQSTKIGTNCSISSVITDKNVEISSDKVLTGSETYPLYIGKDGKI